MRLSIPIVAFAGLLLLNYHHVVVSGFQTPSHQQLWPSTMMATTTTTTTTTTMMIHPESSLSLPTTTVRIRSRLMMALSSTDIRDGHDRNKNIILPRKEKLWKEWGVHKQHTSQGQQPQRPFPDTMDKLVNQASRAVAGAVRQNHPIPNPTRVLEQKQRSLNSQSLGYFQPYNKRNAGRIGVEIDGAEYLFPNPKLVSSSQATRLVSLKLAATLSREATWQEAEQQDEESSTKKKSKKKSSRRKPKPRPVAIYFNTIKQTLMACQELKLLKRAEVFENGGVPPEESAYDHVTILTLKDAIPKSMLLKKTLRRRYGGLSEGYVDPARGIIMVVQPTDFNRDYEPSGPIIGSVPALQVLASQASVHELPLVVLSPRFLAIGDDVSSYYDKWDQSGYQQSATYGGAEPPRGPTPWIMRDFTPPAYSWVGCALRVDDTGHRHLLMDYQGNDEGENNNKNDDDDDEAVDMFYTSRVVMSQTIMEEGHPWHIFSAKECLTERKKKPRTKFDYMASTHDMTGRPTKSLLQSLFDLP